MHTEFVDSRPEPSERLWTDQAAEEIERLRIVRDALRVDRDRIDRELESLDGALSALVRLRPDLRSSTDAQRSGFRAREIDLGRLLADVLRDHPGLWLAVDEVHEQLRKKAGSVAHIPSTNQVRDGLRYLASRRDEIEAGRNGQSRLAYRFRTDLYPVA
jgi:hypothetical protein